MLLAIDVCLGQCAIALSDAGAIRYEMSEPMERGHAERLPEMVRDVLTAAGAKPDALSHIAVTCGPGGFTGARLGVAFARGMALPLQAQTVGISVFDAYAELEPDASILTAIDGKRGEIFLQSFDCGKPVKDAFALPLERDALEPILEETTPSILVGNGAPLIQEIVARPPPINETTPSATHVAKAAERQLANGNAKRAKPLYLRAPDAKPAAIQHGA